ncbi:zf-HC2 domain-containing protein [Nocardia stercoris]|uniref:Putative zinc-finger domain-containing protein n=1 Tax=Nocardia stercoris TaxID=2483361 RepID=A0A3M2L1Q7_9NOCA|nr:zf-HC2 domain-containing protein [Nocardia stercoris]RMI28478.1 hypothetical protein EBN03_30135 [Nocardia stercoris]
MTCETIREALSARIDGEAEPQETGPVDRHLAVCAPCRTWFQYAVVLRTALLPHVGSTPDLTAAILRRLPEAGCEPEITLSSDRKRCRTTSPTHRSGPSKQSSAERPEAADGDDRAARAQRILAP